MNEMNKDRQKQAAAVAAVEKLLEKGIIFSGMKIGLGTGSTALPAIKRISELISEGVLKDIKAVATSFQTENACEKWGIPLYSFKNRLLEGTLDLSIDGADEIDSKNNLIKGGGAALLREKISAYNSQYFAIVADSSKSTDSLGTKFPLPVEFIPEAYIPVKKALEKIGANVTLREGIKKCGPIITDNGNQILDCLWQVPVNPIEMEDKINRITGVVENGFFTKKNPFVFIAHPSGNVEIRGL